MRYKSLCTFLLSICVSVVHSSISNDVTKNMEVTYEDVGPRIGNKLIRSSRSKRPFRNQEEDEDKLSEQEIISKVLDGYDWRVRPRGLNATWKDTGGPVNVTVNIFLRSISKVDDVNMEYSAQFTFREQWRDPRLGFSRLSVQKENLPPFVVLATSEQGTDQQIWMPDTFFQNEKEARRHLIDKPNVLIRIYPDGGILYSVSVAACCRGLEDDLAFQVNPDTFMSNELTVLPIGSPNVPYRPGELLSLVLSCPMSLEYYPLDHQTCIIELASYAYTTADIVYFWKFTEPIQFKDGLRKSLPSFELQDVKTDYCTSKTNTGEYSCLRTKLILRREFSYYLLQLYIPSFMLVIVSWVSFWLDKDSVPARVTLGVTTLLTMTTQSSGINAKLPPVSYTKAIDVWIGVCLAFIFGALLEFALVNYAARKDMMIESRGRGMRRGGGNRQRSLILPPSEDPNEQVNSLAMSPLLQKPLRPELIPANYHPALYQTGPGFPNHTLPSPLPNIPSHSNRPKSRRHAHGCMMAFFRKYKERSKRIDVVSRCLFPMGFFVFNCVYWTVYLM